MRPEGRRNALVGAAGDTSCAWVVPSLLATPPVARVPNPWWFEISGGAVFRLLARKFDGAIGRRRGK